MPRQEWAQGQAEKRASEDPVLPTGQGRRSGERGLGGLQELGLGSQGTGQVAHVLDVRGARAGPFLGTVFSPGLEKCWPLSPRPAQQSLTLGREVSQEGWRVPAA